MMGDLFLFLAFLLKTKSLRVNCQQLQRFNNFVELMSQYSQSIFVSKSSGEKYKSNILFSVTGISISGKERLKSENLSG